MQEESSYMKHIPFSEYKCPTKTSLIHYNFPNNSKMLEFNSNIHHERRRQVFTVSKQQSISSFRIETGKGAEQ